MSLYEDGLRYLGQATSQLGMGAESEVWRHLVSAQVCFNGAIVADADAAPYYARVEALEWMGLLAKDPQFFTLAIADLSAVIRQEQTAARPLLLLNALWVRSRLLQRTNLDAAIADLDQAILLCPRELSFYLARAECQLKRGCPKACTLDLMLALQQLIRYESPLNRDAYVQQYTAFTLMLLLADQRPDERLDWVAAACAELRQFWSNHQQYWFYLRRPPDGLNEVDS